MRVYKIQLEILESQPYKKFLEQIVHDWAGVSDNIAYHLSYLEYLYQVFDQPRLVDYRVLCGLRIKSLVAEIASCAEVLLYDAIVHLSVSDKWGGKYSQPSHRLMGFSGGKALASVWHRATRHGYENKMPKTKANEA